MRPLPSGFLLGCATSAYQVEGGITNDWTEWEASGRLKDRSARCGRATDHWNRWAEDFELLGALGAGAYRFSVEWARVEPSPGRFDDAALARYARMVDALVARGIEPIVTLLHFTHPPWFHALSPWHSTSPDCVSRFAGFVRRVAEVIGDRVRYWTVLNEPGVWLTGAYLAGVMPPGVRSLRASARAFVNLVRAHGAAHRVLRSVCGPRALVGIAHNVMRFVPARARHLGDRFIAGYVAQHYNHAFPTALTSGRVRLGVVPGIRVDTIVPEASGSLDFLGINYYSRVFLELALLSGGRVPVRPFYEDRGSHGLSDLGWEIHPEGLTESLVEMSAYGVPLLVTENGIDDRDDSRRSAFLYDHLGAVLDAVDLGVDVRGYLHWSLLDNFEWLEGFGPRFGLYSVDYRTLSRRPTRAASVFAAIAPDRAIVAGPSLGDPSPGVGRMPVF